MIRSVDSLRAMVGQGGGDDSHRFRPHVAVLGAGKGGVGTSTLAALLGIQAAATGASVLLVDADETVGSLHLLFGLPSEISGMGSLRRGASPEELVVDVEPGLSLFPGGGGGVEATLALAASERRMLLRRVAALYDRYDLVLVDGGSRLDSVMAACAAAAGRLVGITVRDSVAQAAAYALLKVARARFEGLPVDLVVNRATEAEGRAVHELVDSAARTFSGRGVDFAGTTPEDADLAEAQLRGASLSGYVPGRPLGDALGGLAHRLLAGAGLGEAAAPLALAR